MKFIVDNQLPTALATYLRNKGFDCQHVLETGLSDADDAAICKYAGDQERIVISKDEDFFFFAKQPEARIRLIWVRLGNCRTAALLQTFESAWPQMEAAIKAGNRVIELR